MAITDRLRFTVIEMNTNEILARDICASEPVVTKNLSAPCDMKFSLQFGESTKSAAGIEWKSWGQWIVCDIEIDGVKEIFALGAVDDVQVDPETGSMNISVVGWMGYPKGIPWLENFNPIAVDPFEVVQRVWAHVQGFPNAQLGVDVTPASSGTEMLPGYGFDGSILSFDFFAMFIRSVDFNDCGDTIVGLARDIPFDMFERNVWDAGRTEVTKTLELAYPLGGLDQIHLRFVLGENVIQAEKAEETDIEPVSDVIVRSWLPGKVYSARVSNADMTRARRVIMEEDAYIDSTERAAAWAHRKLQRRNVPKHFKKIVINPHHTNAPMGSFDVGDTIRVRAENYPWYGEINEAHRIISITYDEAKGLCELGLKQEGAWNYDPIDYDPDYAAQPVSDPNRLTNGYFASNTMGWAALRGQWFRVATLTYDDTYNQDAGSIRVDTDDNGEQLLSHQVFVTPGEHLVVQCAVKWQELGPSTSGEAIQLKARLYDSSGVQTDEILIDQEANPSPIGGWQLLQDLDYTVPAGVTYMALLFNVTTGIDEGVTWWTYARIYTVGAIP